jgi:hypothetical protein
VSDLVNTWRGVQILVPVQYRYYSPLVQVLLLVLVVLVRIRRIGNLVLASTSH